MRSAQLLMILMASLTTAAAQPILVEIYSPRPFGYFVGDLVRARVDIRAGTDLTIQSASLPRPGPLTVSLNLRSIEVDAKHEGAAIIWRLHITYQTFYVALDAREIEIPGFSVTFSGPSGPEIANVPIWRIGVAPLREVQPTKKDNPLDYMRPDSSIPYVDERSAGNLTIGLGVLTLMGLFAVAHDRAWPPFHTRRARIFTTLARRIVVAAQKPYSDQKYHEALLTFHRAIDAAAGHSILAADLPEFLLAHPEFDPLASYFQRFFAASRDAFFGALEDPVSSEFGMAELADFARRLAAQERSTS